MIRIAKKKKTVHANNVLYLCRKSKMNIQNPKHIMESLSKGIDSVKGRMTLEGSCLKAMI